MENHYPSIDVLQSVSRVMPHVIDERHKSYAGKFIDALSTYKKFEDMINLGAYKQGANFKVDHAISIVEKLKNYMKQDMNERIDYPDSMQGLYAIFDSLEKINA